MEGLAWEPGVGNRGPVGSRATGSDVTGTGSYVTGTGSHVVWNGKPQTGPEKRERGLRVQSTNQAPGEVLTGKGSDKEDAMLKQK